MLIIPGHLLSPNYHHGNIHTQTSDISACLRYGHRLRPRDCETLLHGLHTCPRCTGKHLRLTCICTGRDVTLPYGLKRRPCCWRISRPIHATHTAGSIDAHLSDTHSLRTLPYPALSVHYGLRWRPLRQPLTHAIRRKKRWTPLRFLTSNLAYSVFAINCAFSSLVCGIQQRDQTAKYHATSWLNFILCACRRQPNTSSPTSSTVGLPRYTLRNSKIKQQGA